MTHTVRFWSRTAGFVLLAAAASHAAAQGAPEPGAPEPGAPQPGARKPEVHPDFRQLIPRGRMASVDAPQFVTANEAEISGDAWVLGVEIGGEKRAYSLNLLNRHEVVNDQIGGRTFSAVW